MKYIQEEHYKKKHSTLKENIQASFEIQEKQDEQKITLEGYLFIQSRSLWRFPQHLWKKRYFSLVGDTLYFTKSEKDNFYDETAEKIEIEADTGIYPEENEKGKSKFYIRITQGKQNIILCSTDQTERNKWLSSLLTVITQKYVVNFKSGAYKSIRLNYREKKHTSLKQRHSSFLPRRLSDDVRQNEFKMRSQFGSLVFTKAESMFNLNSRDLVKDRKSLVALT